ncbi:MAG TPA: AAA family ATPase [Polyangia bacterium]
MDTRLATRFQEAARVMEQHFLDKQEVIRLLLVSVAAGEHMLLVGPPGTAKSALVRTFAKLIDARYFEYLLTRFTEPNELFGPVDIRAFREGTYTRKTETMLPEAEIVFLDEIFKSNSAILNSLLTILNERKFANGSKVQDVPLLSMFGASNEVPNDDNLAAIFDRFLLRVVSDNLDSYHFHNLIAKGIANEAALLTGKAAVERPLFSARDLHGLHKRFDAHLAFGEDFLSKYKGLIFQIRSEGISVSDRRVVKLLKLFAASAIVDGRDQANDSDFFILKHIWNNLDQTEILEEIVGPVVDRWYRDHPAERRFAAGQVGLDDLLGELQIIRELLTSGEALSDIQLFSQLKNLNEIKAALQAVDSETARRMVAEVDALLENVFASSKFG